MNDYYKSNIDDYSRGTIEFPFQDLALGYHSITFKIWDVFNNSSESTIDFYVTNDGRLNCFRIFKLSKPIFK